MQNEISRQIISKKLISQYGHNAHGAHIAAAITINIYIDMG